MGKAVIFDLNGVFLKSDFLSERVEKKWGVKVEEFVSALKQVMGVVRKPNAPAAFSLWKPYLDRWGVVVNEKEFFSFWFSGEHVVSELVDYAKNLKENGYQVFVLSNNFKERTDYYRDHFPELFSLFDGVYFSWETGFVKPQKEAFMNLLEMNNLKPDECIYFDDSEDNVEVAKKLGIRSEIYIDLETTRIVIGGKKAKKNQKDKVV